MNTNVAVQNLDNLIATSKMTRQDHIVLSQSLDYLRMRASILDDQEQAAKDAAKEQDVEKKL